MNHSKTRPSAAFTEGPIGRTLFIFSLPIFASSVLQSINASINAAWIGRLLGERALTAGANANTLVFLMVGVLFGLGMAATVLVGQSLGAKDLDQAKRTIGTGVTLFGGAATVMALAGVLFAPSVLAAMHTPPDALPLAASYLRVISIGLPGMFLYTFAMTALRGAGDSKTPFVFLLFSALTDVVLNPLLIRGVGPI
ncbi:MAG TPA: MATE family efflux transporter, partial [Polyangiaceae bacterium]|nr:MATE family efflux transporter [Polyangiaceae bacterium]